MDAKPQRAFRAPSTVNNENMAPVLFKNHQRQKSTGAAIYKDAGVAPVKIPAKRTAFGDVSNMVRPSVDNLVTGFKSNTAPNVPKVGIISTAPMPAPPASAYTKDAINKVASAGSTVPSAPSAPSLPSTSTAGFLAPAQRPRNSIAVFSSASQQELDSQNVIRQAQEPRRPTVVFSNAIESSHAPAVLRPEVATLADHAIETSAVNWSKPSRSPRHSKSQPCLKNASGFQLQQKKTLRRTLSRLPVDNVPKEVVVFADNNTSHPGEKPIVEPIYHEGANYVVLDNNDDHLDVNEAPFVDAVEDFDHHGLPPLPDEDTEDDIGRLREEIEAAVIESHGPTRHTEDKARYLPPPAEAARSNFLSEAPAVTVASAMSEVEEPWDDDADFYDDQAYTTAHSFRSQGDNTTGGLTTVLMPKVTAKVQNELDIAKAIVEASISPEDLDDDIWDISMVAEYGDEIYGYMKELEVKMLPNAYYMDMQTEIQWSMRSVLMEWLIQVHARFNLLPETLFLTVNYIDRFLSSKIVSVAKLQLVGATAIFIASKYEEIICPSIQEIIYMVDHGYTTDEILKAERFMLSMLGFELGWPGPMSFLRRISKADDYDLDTRTLAKYFLEVTIMDERFVACPPSFLAAGAHCLARLMLFKGDWTMAHTYYSGYTWSQVRPLANTILQCCRDPTTHHAAVYEKYASNKFKKASIYVEEEMRRGFMVPSAQTIQQNRHRQSIEDSYGACSDESGAVPRFHRPDLAIQS